MSNESIPKGFEWRYATAHYDDKKFRGAPDKEVVCFPYNNVSGEVLGSRMVIGSLHVRSERELSDAKNVVLMIPHIAAL